MLLFNFLFYLFTFYLRGDRSLEWLPDLLKKENERIAGLGESFILTPWSFLSF